MRRSINAPLVSRLHGPTTLGAEKYPLACIKTFVKEATDEKTTTFPYALSTR